MGNRKAPWTQQTCNRCAVERHTNPGPHCEPGHEGACSPVPSRWPVTGSCVCQQAREGVPRTDLSHHPCTERAIPQAGTTALKSFRFYKILRQFTLMFSSTSQGTKEVITLQLMLGGETKQRKDNYIVQNHTAGSSKILEIPEASGALVLP